MPPRRPAFRYTAAFLLLPVLFAASYPLWFRWMGQYLIESEPPFHADAAVVLAGDWYGDRILEAAQLVRRGYAPVALISGPVEIYGVNEGELAIQFAVRRGYPREYFHLMASSSFSTREEADYFSHELAIRNVHKLMIVTSDYHTRRAGRFFRARLGPAIEVRMIAVPDRYFSPSAWWHNREGRKVFFYEWSKTVAGLLGM